MLENNGWHPEDQTNNPAIYKVRWGADEGGRPCGAEDDTWEAIDHGAEGNLSRALHFDRILNELCAREGMSLREAQADRYAQMRQTVEADEPAMLSASESEDDGSADDTGSDDDSASDGEASDASEGSGGRDVGEGSDTGHSSHGES